MLDRTARPGQQRQGLLLVAQAVLFSGQVLGNLLLSRATGASSYADFAKWNTVFAVAYACTESWSGLAVLRAEGEDKVATAARTVALARGCVVGAACVLGSIWAFTATARVAVVVAGAVGAVSLSLAEISRVVAIARGKSKHAALADIAAGICGVFILPILLSGPVSGATIVMYFCSFCLLRGVLQVGVSGGRMSVIASRDVLILLTREWRRNYGYTVLVTSSRNVDNVIVNWAYGGLYLGIYARAYSLLLAPIMQVSAALSPLVQRQLFSASDDERVLICVRWTRLLAVPALALAGGTCLLAGAAVPAVLGPQWASAVGPVRLLSVCGAAILMQLPTLWLAQVSGGRPGPSLFATSSMFPVALLWLASPLGFDMALVGYTVFNVLVAGVLTCSTRGMTRTQVLRGVAPFAGLLILAIVAGP